MIPVVKFRQIIDAYIVYVKSSDVDSAELRSRFRPSIAYDDLHFVHVPDHSNSGCIRIKLKRIQ